MAEPAQKLELDSLAYVKRIDKETEWGDCSIQCFYHNIKVFLTGGTEFIGTQELFKKRSRKDKMLDPAQQMELEAMSYVKAIDKATEQGDSDIQRFYHGSTVFLTGGTGFIGKQLIEKLFRSCEIKKLFVLIRPKKGQSINERLQVILSDPVFEPVRKLKPDLETRIVGVAGDVADIRLGISDTDWNTIVDEVEVIFHVAATVRFDEAIRLATMTNVRGTRETLRLGRACKNLRSFVHVSTAYSHATSERVGNDVFEQFYESPVPPETIIQLAETVDNSKLETITSSLISGWPNTYTFTKAIAETLVQAEVGYLPVCIVRPSIVICTYREPAPGWLDISCMYGCSGVGVASGLGMLRVILINKTSEMSFVPVDFVNNATIAAGWETAVKRTPEAKIYNITSSNSGVNLEYFFAQSDKIRKIMSPRAIWYYYLIVTSNRLVYCVFSWLLHYIPAYTVDAVINLLKLKKPQGVKSFIHVYGKFNKMMSSYEYFINNEWNFNVTNLNNLWLRMSDTDRKIYNFKIRSIDWNHITLMWCLGCRKYLIKDGLKGTRKAVARQKWFKLANIIVAMVYVYIFWKILSYVWYFLNKMF